MITKFKIKNSILIFFASLMLACGVEALIFIPLFAAEWSVVGDSDYFIDLRPDDPNFSKSGVFTGREIHFSDDLRDDNNFTGTFNGLKIEFSIIRTDPTTNDPLPAIQFNGTMTPISDKDHNIMRIDLTSSEGSLILE